ncbi:hypothetical protein Ciccas_005125 [Cichlidogyrus casuarinus]|uniref:Uncharacterized protein n=1 Tax=Cichlidogyrus casuarinus TaxID=1844966 RepID=A0ABD2Q9J2_9PLAT
MEWSQDKFEEQARKLVAHCENVAFLKQSYINNENHLRKLINPQIENEKTERLDLVKRNVENVSSEIQKVIELLQDGCKDRKRLLELHMQNEKLRLDNKRMQIELDSFRGMKEQKEQLTRALEESRETVKRLVAKAERERKKMFDMLQQTDKAKDATSLSKPIKVTQTLQPIKLAPPTNASVGCEI